MKRLTRWTPPSFVRLGLVRFLGVLLAAVTLLTLALALSGLMLPASAASAAAPFKPPRQTATPTTIPTSTPIPRPTATNAPSSTATATPTAAATATSTALPHTSTAKTTGAGPEASSATASSLQPLLLWGIGVMIAALLIFGAGIWLFARRAVHQSQQQPAFASYAQAPSRERLNQLRQLLPARKAAPPAPGDDEQEATETPIAEAETSQPLSPPSKSPWSSTPKPPQWLIDAGFLKDSASEQPLEPPEEP